MKKIILLTLVFFLVSNCSVPGSALLGPIFTGAKTGSVYQASLSYGTNKMMTKVINDDKEKKRLKDINSKISFNDDQIIIVSTFAVEKVEFSEVLEPEPLP